MDSVTEELFPLKSDEHLLVKGYHEAFLLDRNRVLLRTIQRRPNRNWLAHVCCASVAADGTFALLADDGRTYDAPREVSLYTASGDPVRTIQLPAECLNYCFAYTEEYIVMRLATEIYLTENTGKPRLKFTPAIERFNDNSDGVYACFGTHGDREL